MTQHAVVTLRVPGFHSWPGAHGDRAYLAHRHRHVFHVRVELVVHHNEREVEYHDLLRVVRYHFARWYHHSREDTTLLEFGGESCETIAAGIVAMLAERYAGRTGRVEVLEDGECGTVCVF